MAALPSILNRVWQKSQTCTSPVWMGEIVIPAIIRWILNMKCVIWINEKLQTKHYFSSAHEAWFSSAHNGISKPVSWANHLAVRWAASRQLKLTPLPIGSAVVILHCSLTIFSDPNRKICSCLPAQTCKTQCFSRTRGCFLLLLFFNLKKACNFVLAFKHFAILFGFSLAIVCDFYEKSD